ncbi:MAG: polyprenyl diphosphate synthase [Nanobdellota archaeon]
MEKLHIAVIMDGNRRWAEKNGLNKLEGHKYGAKKLENFIIWCEKLNVKEMTIYTLSTENLKRTKKEIESLYNLFRSFLKKIDEKIPEETRINFLGDMNLFPDDLREKMEEIKSKTKKKSKYILNFCMGYGGRDEIIKAVNKAIKEGEEIDEKGFENLLYTKSSPDIVIRTGGKIRTSNFLPWQAVYSEWFFIEKLWPDIDKNDLTYIIKNFYSRQRNYGK